MRWAPVEGAGRLLDAVLFGVRSRVGAARRLATVGLLCWRRPAKRVKAVGLRWLGGVVFYDLELRRPLGTLGSRFSPPACARSG